MQRRLVDCSSEGYDDIASIRNPNEQELPHVCPCPGI